MCVWIARITISLERYGQKWDFGAKIDFFLAQKDRTGPGPTLTGHFWKKNLQIYILPSPVPTYGRSCPSILEHQDHKGSPRTSQDQSYMILAFLHPQTFSKTAPTCVRSSPGILEPSGPWRITKDKQGPVLHDPFQNHFANSRWSCNSLLFLTIMKTWYALDMHFKHIIEEVS